jgi:hypothetical protein
MPLVHSSSSLKKGVRTLFSILHYNLFNFRLTAKKYKTKIKGRKIVYINMSFFYLNDHGIAVSKIFLKKIEFFVFLSFSQNYYSYVKLIY